ncbi:Ribokinase-like protein, partial [Lizonia empirigonia]
RTPTLPPTMPHIICVGAVYMDTILTVPHFLREDTKLRATHLARRRGGNAANTLEVLTQLVSHTDDLSTQDAAPTRLSLLAPLPAAHSPDARAVAASLPGVHMGLCLHRDAPEAPSSYIIQSVASRSRTVVSANTLEEMSAGEFEGAVRRVVPGAGSTGQVAEQIADGDGEVWIHFEGRNPDVVLPCVRWLRRTYGSGRVRVSVECEKPEREGMRDVAALADVIFYSRLWAEIPHTLPSATLLCTWGSSGAALLQKAPGGMHTRASPPTRHSTPTALSPPPIAPPNRAIDTVGAGDTFIAGMLYALSLGWRTETALAYANEVAGRKVVRRGFGGLGQR